MNGNPALIDAIRRYIAASGGRITFAHFMQLALYHPQHGYYSSGSARIGKEGDYFTSVSTGPLFGKLLARQFQQFKTELGNPPEFEVIECGGHHGQLRDDLLAAAPGLRYRVIEIGDPLPDSIVGCVFSNELLDALPVHRICVSGGRWQEIYVQTTPPMEGEPPGEPVAQTPSSTVNPCNPCNPWTAEPVVSPPFRETLGPLSTPLLADSVHDLPANLMEGYRTEINLRARSWLENVARRLTRGFVLTIDYGYERNEYFAPHHREGTLLCYHQHMKNDNPYINVGEQDITAHVEFTSLIEHGKRCGLDPVLFTDQSHYLLKIGEPDITEIVERTAGQLSKERSAIHQLLHPELMGHTFKILIQRK